MNRNVIALLLILAACAADKPAPVAAVRKPAAQPERTVTVSPAVAALLHPDPDVDKKLSEEEIKATLARVQNKPAQPVVVDLGQQHTGDYKKLEDDKDARLKAYNDKLDNTTVYQGPDGSYHSASCPSLTVTERSTDGREREKFVGKAMTLRAAKDSHIGAHSSCGAPSYEFSYN